MCTFTFSESEVYVCDFHREQCWLRWTSLHKHGVTSDREELLQLMRNIATSTTADDFSASVKLLKGSPTWSSNAALRQWFERIWLREHKVRIYTCLPMTLVSVNIRYMRILAGIPLGGDLK